MEANKEEDSFVDYALVDCFDSILKAETQKFNFSDPPVNPIDLAHLLTRAMIKERGIGLAAPQIGLLYRVFAISSNPCLVCFNPIIVDSSHDSILLDEGCLSFPGVSIMVRRPKSIRVRYTQPNGETVTHRYEGMTARIFQHELAHLNGRTMLDDASQIQREKALKQIKKLRRERK